MRRSISPFRKIFLFLPFSFAIFSYSYCADITHVSPLTKNIILIVFDDGTVNYPNDLQVSSLDVTAAVLKTNYTIISSDHAGFFSAVNPVDIGRKSKGTEFVKDAPWGGNSFDPTSKPWASKHFIYLFLDMDMESGKTYSLNTGTLAGNGEIWNFTFDEKELRSEAVHVNTIGYETNAPKYGYVYQWMGDRGGLKLSEYSGNGFYIFKEGETDPVLSGLLKKRKSATNAETSQANDTPNKNFLGSEVYECDFSSLTADGTYKLVVEGIGSSYPFKIGKDALWEAYYTVGRSLFYQRSGIRLAPPYTDGDYIRPVNQNTKVSSDDGTDFSGKLLYSNVPFAKWVDENGGTAEDGGIAKQEIKDSAANHPLDVAGWYHDAGDWDGYYSHQRIPILLMLTYEYFPERFADGDLNLPESGNGIPDLVDEASWLIKWNYRLRKELMAKGYSDGGVGGARVCPDVYNSEDGNAETNKPSWQDNRRYVVSQADAFMTYLYAGQAAQFALILKKLGKDPHNFPVEMLDAVEFSSMTKDNVDWVKEAEEAYAWASDPANQPESGQNYASDLGVYKMYAGVNIFRLTNKSEYQEAAIPELEKVKNSASLAEDERYAVYSYMLADNYTTDKNMKTALVNAVKNTAMDKAVTAAGIRACRWGGVYSMPMLIGQATTPWIFETMIAYGLTGEKQYLDVCHTTADYFLGTNPMHSTWTTGLGPRPAEAGFHLDSRYNNNWVTYPGFIPYGPWSMSYGYTPYFWTIDGVLYEGGHGPWNKDWANFSQYPMMYQWPGHERWNSNIHAPLSTENTVHQNSVYGALTYGFVNNRQNRNSGSAKAISAISLDKTEITISEQGGVDTIQSSIDIDDATIGALKWISSDLRVAHVDQMGRVTGVTSGTCTITCSTLDGSVSASCEITCSWSEVAVESITIDPDTLVLVEGQSSLLEVFFSPGEVTNTFVDWTYSDEGIVEVDETGKLEALSPGNVLVIATSLNGGKIDTCVVKVLEAVDYIIADFDAVIPVMTEPKPDSAQIYTPNGGSSDIEFLNPIIGLANPSTKVAKYDRPSGTYPLIGMILPTEEFQSTDKYSQFQFKYYGKELSNFYIQLIAESGEQFDYNVSAQGYDAWQLFMIDLNSTYNFKQFNIFPNPSDEAAFSSLYDDFMLSASPAIRYEGLSISDNLIELNSAEDNVITITADAEGNPFTWVSLDTTIVKIDQSGALLAIRKGTTKVVAVPLHGEPAECIIKVDGGAFTEPETYETNVLLDFENYELDWTSGYGAYAWASTTWSKSDNPSTDGINASAKVFSWDRDDSNFGAGYGIQFPTADAGEWSRISLMAYCESEINALRIAIKNGETEIGAFQADIHIPAYNWTQIVLDLADFNLLFFSFNRIELQFGIGTQESYTVFLDNVWLERGTLIPVADLLILDSFPINMEKEDEYQVTAVITPVNASENAISWESDMPDVASVSNLGLVQGVAAGTAIITASADENSSISKDISVIVTATGLEEQNFSLISYYPNPVAEKLYIRSDRALKKIELFNMEGKSLIRKEVQGSYETVVEDISYESGLYFIRITLEDESVIIGKIVMLSGWRRADM